MPRLVLTLALAALTLACSGPMAFVPLGERSSGTRLQFEQGETEAAGELLAFDPARHSLDISIELPLDQEDDIDVFIITSSGLRFQILGSFHNCHVNGARRQCPRQLPVLPAETSDNWRVEAERNRSRDEAAVEVAVSWVPLGG